MNIEDIIDSPPTLSRCETIHADVQFRPIRTLVTWSVGVDWLVIGKWRMKIFRQDKKFTFFYKIKGLDPRVFD